jgi:L-seryl-tRNA(Ser) seleniumtransferase
LLEHPRVKSVVTRINQSTLAHRATGFLDELRSSLAERTGRVEMPSVTQLAERLARRLLGEPQASGPVINATGVVVGAAAWAPPLADAALHAMMQVAGEYHHCGGETVKAIERDLCSLSGAEAALVLSSFDAALNVAFAATAANREASVVGGSDPANAGVDWRRIAARHASVLQTVADSESLPTASRGVSPPAVIVRASDAATTTTEVAQYAKQANACLIDVAPLAGVINPSTYGLPSIETLEDRLAAGADLVVADGAGLLGGPGCGVLVGKRKVIEAVAAHHLASLAALDAARAAALHATLVLYREDHDGSAALAIPVWQLLSAPLANLLQRAERLAAQIAASAQAAAATAREVESSWCGAAGAAPAKSWIIAVGPAKGDAASLLGQLRQRPYPIVAAEAEGAVHLDLRSVFPRWDQQLVAAFEAADA